MKEVLLNEEQIEEICKRIGKEISDALKNEERIPILVGVMKGSLNFMINLMKYITVPFYTDYIQISSYYGTTRTNHVRLLKDLSYDCTDRTIIIIEDIVDTEKTVKREKPSRKIIDNILNYSKSLSVIVGIAPQPLLFINN